jgi:hypothetical protein
VILPVNRQAAADRAIAHQRSEVVPHVAGVDGGIRGATRFSDRKVFVLKITDLGADDVFARISDPCLRFLEGWPNE